MAVSVRKGRGATRRNPHRFEAVARVPDGDARDAAVAQVDDAPLPPLATEVRFEDVRSLLAYNDSPDLGFDRAINPYRGCEHGCPYCYARPRHSYLNLSPGLDFETKLVAKRNAAEVLARELGAPGYRPATINIGAATDAYQPIERELRITRAIVELLVRTRHPFVIVTKSALVERDLDLLAPAAAHSLTGVFISLTTLEPSLARRLEPRAASPWRRLRTIETLARAGIPVRVNVAPIIPFINEPEIERLLQAAADAGACGAHYAVLRLPWEVDAVFQDWLQAHFPQRATRVMNRVREMRGGKHYDSRFGVRMKGEGVWAALICQRFEKAAARAGLFVGELRLRTDLFEPSRVGSQLTLF
ncbi:MAG: PA0069 family radical SAM protein [Sutterellaceae bacterium]|nr:PA0069 family radical SAM protein [Burkholderiaceae bacterium]MCX7901017.1 PA0069 family radical SAM protein [Burkholderiaceae bacterium]MDW8430357.1 PA0069 family radical SAM protein [Sutterellaceae bacterium]